MLLSETILMQFVLSQNRPFCPTLKSAVLSHFRNRRFCPIFEIGGFVSFEIGDFVPFPKSAILSHLNLALLSCPQLINCVSSSDKNKRSNDLKLDLI